MPEAGKAGLTKALQIVVPLTGVTIAVISLVFTLAAKRKELTCSYLGSDKVVSLEVRGIDPQLKMEFLGQPVASLVKMNFVLRNTGAAGLKADDVKEPLGLQFPEEVSIVNSVEERTTPSGFSFHTTALRDRRLVTLDFLLLNSGDEAFFSVYLCNSKPALPQFRGRVVDVTRLLMLDDSVLGRPNPFPLANSRAVRRVTYWILFSFNVLLSLLVLSIIVGVSKSYVGHLVWRSRWGARYDEAARHVEEAVRAAVASTARGHPTRMALELERKVRLGKALKEAGIPPSSYSIDSLTEYLGTTLVLTVFLVLFASTSYFLYSSPRGY
jgi:hypothetical protein